MSEHGKAVFLSYASQDAEAAKRIADALRSAGVEVWFDQSELVGGDAWDAKIRKQIGSCALFMPVISAGTQARAEGYFRLEWKLADRRTDLIGKSKTFLLPVCIDDTRDSEADVPDSFTAVQWTRLKGGETPPAFVARVKKLLEGPEVGASLDDARGRRPAAPLQPAPRIGPWLALGAVAVVVLALAISRPWPRPASTGSPVATVAAPVAQSEARKLVAQARALFEEGDEVNHENISLAEDLLDKAQALDSTDAEVWAAQAAISRIMTLVGYDVTATRRALLQKQAERAIKLDPHSIKAGIAYAAFLTDAGGASAVEAARQLQALDARAPGQHDLLQALGLAYSVAGFPDESIAALDRANALPGGDARALAQKAAQLVWYGNCSNRRRQCRGR